MSDTTPLTPGELRQRLGLSSSPFYRLQQEGELNKFELAEPLGLKRYSSVLVDQFLAGGSIAKFGRGSRSARRVSG